MAAWRDRILVMLATAALIAVLGLADSINPVTILVAVYLGSGPDPARRLAGFIAGVLGVYLLGGLALTLGPAQLLDHALTGVEIPGADVAAVASGTVLIVVGVAVWRRRRRLAHLGPPDALVRAGSTGRAALLGAVVTLIDLPTAFPYFGAIGVVVGAGEPIGAQVLLLVIFNLLYVVPLVLVLVARLAFGERCREQLGRARAAVEQIAAPLLAAGAGVAGVLLVARGAGGLLA